METNAKTKHIVEVIKRLLTSEKRILIIISRPLDCDAIASGLILKKYLQSKGKFVTVRFPQKFTPDQKRFFEYLPFFDEIEDGDTRELFDKERFDLLILVDGANLIQYYDTNITENRPPKLDLYKKRIHIDHHELSPEKLGSVKLHSKKVSSTTELILTYLIPQEYIDSCIATLAYAAIVQDTGNFQWSTSAQTLHIAAELLVRGAHILEILEKLFFSRSKTYIEMLALAAQLVKYKEKIQTTFLCVPYKLVRKYNLDTYKLNELKQAYLDNCSYMVNGYARGFLILEKEPRSISIYARGSNYSNTINLPQLLLALGGNGGGHFHAAGITIEENFDTIKQMLTKEIRKSIKEQKSESN